MVAANANILTEMKEKSKAEGKAEECELTEDKVKEILESVGIK